MVFNGFGQPFGLDSDTFCVTGGLVACDNCRRSCERRFRCTWLARCTVRLAGGGPLGPRPDLCP